MKKMAETKKEEKKRLADEDATRRIKQLEESVESLKRQVQIDLQQIYTLNQGSKGIRQWPVNCCTSPIMKNKITPSVDYNEWLKHLYSRLIKATNQNSLKVLKVVKPTNKKR